LNGESDKNAKADAPPTRPADRRLSAAAERALAEAAERRAKKEVSLPREINGRDGPEPTRYGDWEVRGIASDF
jgi:hypothetical protein